MDKLDFDIEIRTYLIAETVNYTYHVEKNPDTLSWIVLVMNKTTKEYSNLGKFKYLSSAISAAEEHYG